MLAPDTPSQGSSSSSNLLANGAWRVPNKYTQTTEVIPNSNSSESSVTVPPSGSQSSASSARQAADMTPESLQNAPLQVKRLRMNKKTASAADQFLKDIGYIPASQGNSNSDISPADGQWPEDFVDRLNGADPTYDSLKLSEFITGYIAIMEETLPEGVDLTALRKHFAHLRSMMVDCAEVQWVTTRTAHKQVLLGIHYPRFKWEDQKACLDAKRDTIQRILRIPTQAVAQQMPTPEVPITPCPPIGELSVPKRMLKIIAMDDWILLNSIYCNSW